MSRISSVCTEGNEPSVLLLMRLPTRIRLSSHDEYELYGYGAVRKKSRDISDEKGVGGKFKLPCAARRVLPSEK
jgi:hypothetical protein